MASSYRLSLNRWLAERAVVAATVFDVGGAQEKTNKRVAKWEVNNYVVLDLAQPHADSPPPDKVFNIETDHWQPDKDGQADVVFCLEVFDYLINPIKAMRNLAAMTKTGGIIYVSYPFFYPTHQPIEAEGLRYTENAVKRLGQAANLQLHSIFKRRPETDAVEQLWRRERLRAAKNYDHDVLGWIAEFRKPV